MQLDSGTGRARPARPHMIPVRRKMSPVGSPCSMARRTSSSPVTLANASRTMSPAASLGITTTPSMSPAVASELLKWRFSESDQQRMAELAAKARQGTLTADEQTEIDGYDRVSSFLGLVKSKAR